MEGRLSEILEKAGGVNALAAHAEWVEWHGLPLAKHRQFQVARFDLHRGEQAWLVDMQSELTARLTTSIAVPLLPVAGAPLHLGELNPVFAVDGAPHMLVVQMLAAIPRRELGPAQGSLAHEGDAITRALAPLFTGF